MTDTAQEVAGRLRGCIPFDVEDSKILQEAAALIASQAARIAELENALRECKDYFDIQTDFDFDPEQIDLLDTVKKALTPAP